MTLVVLLSLALQGESAVRDALAFLVRHQATDGSWGDAPAGCTCPAAPARPPVSIADLQALWESDPAVVEAAQRRLEESGADALPWLRKAAEGISQDVRARHLEVIRRIERNREGCEVELTALALLAFIWAKDTDRDAVRRGLGWLLSRQTAEGGFGGDSPAADWVAAEAVVRLGHCGEPAERARRWLRKQSLARLDRLDGFEFLIYPPIRPVPELRCGNGVESMRLDDPKAELRERQRRSGCEAGSWEGPGIRHAIGMTAWATMTLR